MATNQSTEKDPFQGQYRYRYQNGHQTVVYRPQNIWGFLAHVIELRKLPINEVLTSLTGPGSFFLVAGTGLGKTVAVPLWLLFRKMYYKNERPPLVEGSTDEATVSPRVWVVEPRISICQGLQTEMNRLWFAWVAEFMKQKPPRLFGAKTRVDHTQLDAPIGKVPFFRTRFLILA